MREEWIYCLRARISGEIFYIGRSVRPAERIREHGCRPDWRRSLLNPDTRPVGSILQRCSNHTEARWAEQRWIDELLYAGARLVNVQGAAAREWTVANRKHKWGAFAEHILAG